MYHAIALSDIKMYKTRVNDEGKYQKLQRVEKTVLDSVVRAHLKKAVTLVVGPSTSEIPSEEELEQTTQHAIFSKQKSDFIVHGKVAILSGLSLFVTHYFGLNVLCCPVLDPADKPVSDPHAAPEVVLRHEAPSGVASPDAPQT